MKLSEEILKEGRNCVVRKDLDGIEAWSRKHAPMDFDLLRKTMNMCFKAGDVAMAMKLFNTTFEGYDPDVEKAKKTLVVGGCLGAIAIVIFLLVSVTYLVFFKP